uniref:BTB domain-containing protein n=1 Tax=Graphocephala atropunctata TaxID=36148 RepID=A0A1B6K961_9HEMI
MALQGNYNLKWHGHGGHLNYSISKLYHTDYFTDVVLATGDGQHVSAHQFVLSACSSYLHKMFCVGKNSSKVFAKMFVVLPFEISFTTLTVLLQYIYRGEAVVSHEQLPEIMKAADILQIKGLCTGKDKPNVKSSTRTILKQQTQSSSELKHDTENTNLNQRVLIPEMRYSGEPVSINDIDFNKNPIIVNELSKRSPLNTPSPTRKKQKGNPIEVLSGNNCKRNEEKAVTEKLKEEEEIQVKEEPLDWEDQKSTDDDGSILKQEAMSDEEIEVDDDKCFVPLTCDLCQKTFTTPALWVRHIEQTHPTTALASGKRPAVEDDGTKEFPPLHCELCKQVFSVPAEWVRHIQSHSEDQPSEPNKESTDSQSLTGRRVQCKVCGKVLQSQASMQIHARTHTGECPYLCKVCGRQFNVKSNFVRHMRTLHNEIVNY